MQASSHRTSALRGFLGFVAVTFASALTAQTVLDEEIVVTARKVEENPQDIPIAVSAFSQESIQRLNIESTDEIALFTPGLSYNSAFGRQPGSDRASIRGVTTILNGPANTGSVATFVDGVYVGGTTQTTELYNLERVEILRGPQAAQFGRGTYAGAINYITKGPSEVFEGDVSATAGENDEYRLNSWISGPIFGDTLGFYAGVGYYTYDGDYTNRKIGDTARTQGQELGDDIGGEETKSISGKLFWNPTDKLSVTAKLGYEETDDDHFPIYLQTRFIQPRNNQPGLDPVTPFKQNNCCERTANSPRAREYFNGTARKTGPVQLNTDILDQAGIDGVEIDRKIFALTVDYDIEGFWFLDGSTASSLTGYVDDEITQGLDATYGGYEFFRPPLPPFLFGSFNQIDDDSQEDLSQEFRLTSSRDEEFRWAAGLYYYRGETKENRDERAFVDAGTGNVVRANQFNAGLDRTRVEDKAVFGSVEWDMLDNLTGTVELRYSTDEVKLRTLNQTGGTTRLRRQDSESFWLPRYTLTYSFNDDVNFYANVSKGVKPQDINSSIPNTPAGTPDESKRFVEPEEAWNYELGMKSLWLDGRALFNISGYFFDITDQQLTQNLVDPNTGQANSFLDSVGETEVWGMEVEGSMLFGEYLTVGFNYAYADSEIKEYINQDQADLLGSDGSAQQNRLLGDVSGNQSPRVPEHMFSFTSRYERPWGRDGTWFVSANYAWEDSKYAQVHNLIETGERSDLRASLGGTWGPWALSIWGKNLTDDQSAIDIIRYVDGSRASLPNCPSLDPNAVCTATSPSNTPRGFGVTLPRKRQFGATLSYKFGGNL